jgi:hypothetical protein
VALLGLRPPCGQRDPKGQLRGWAIRVVQQLRYDVVRAAAAGLGETPRVLTLAHPRGASAVLGSGAVVRDADRPRPFAPGAGRSLTYGVWSP